MEKILVITEGPTDKRFLKRLFSISDIASENVEVVCFDTNLYRLIQLYEDMGCSYKWIDLQQVLKESKTKLTSNERKALDDSYTAILLVFDAEFQDPLFDGNRLMKFMKHFKDPSDYGKLYINYPMVEAFRHVSPSDIANKQSANFLSLKVPLSDLSSYKKMVDQSGFKLEQRTPVSDIKFVIELHKQKIKQIIQLVSESVYEQKHLIDLLNVQLKLAQSASRELYVVSTSATLLDELGFKK